MSGNGRGAARAQNRSPPFLVIGLLVALAILGFNYWNLSSSNGTLSSTNVDLQDQIRILTGKRLSEEQSKREVERKYTLLEQRISMKDSEIKRLQEDVEAKRGEAKQSNDDKQQCESNLKTCNDNNEGIQQQLKAVTEEVEKLRQQDSGQNCDSVCKEQTKKVYTEIFQKLGAQPLQQMINAGIDIGDDLKVQVQQAASGDKQIKPPVDQQPQAQTQQQQQQQPQAPDAKDVQTGDVGKTQKGVFDRIIDIKENIQKSINQSLSENTPLHDKLKKKIDEGLQSFSQDKVKEGLKSLSEKSGVPLHDILNKTQEGIKQGFKKSQEIAELIYGGEGNKMHDTSNKTERGDNNDLKTDNLVGNNTEPKKDSQKTGDDKTPENNKVDLQGEKTPQVTVDKQQADEKLAKTVKEEDDPAYDDEDEKELDKVEERKDPKFEPEEKKDLKFEPEKEGDGIDKMKKNMDLGGQ